MANPFLFDAPAVASAPAAPAVQNPLQHQAENPFLAGQPQGQPSGPFQSNNIFAPQSVNDSIANPFLIDDVGSAASAVVPASSIQSAPQASNPFADMVSDPPDYVVPSPTTPPREQNHAQPEDICESHLSGMTIEEEDQKPTLVQDQPVLQCKAESAPADQKTTIDTNRGGKMMEEMPSDISSTENAPNRGGNEETDVATDSKVNSNLVEGGSVPTDSEAKNDEDTLLERQLDEAEQKGSETQVKEEDDSCEEHEHGPEQIEEKPMSTGDALFADLPVTDAKSTGASIFGLSEESAADSTGATLFGVTAPKAAQPQLGAMSGWDDAFDRKFDNVSDQTTTALSNIPGDPFDPFGGGNPDSGRGFADCSFGTESFNPSAVLHSGPVGQSAVDAQNPFLNDPIHNGSEEEEEPLFDDDTSRPLEQMPRVHERPEGWEMFTRYPPKKKLTAQR